ncbi:MAG: NADH-quinone oxidoreductase subunit D [Candidatus Methylarchaceae archaeon HK01M]|nr:NADH-quinone oxidoreductase subunit D [Candidatus Methylarchaceae archaeon HK01M]
MSIMKLSMGPQHPVTSHFRFILDVDGDAVLNFEWDVGYTHRGIEKIAENRIYVQNIPVVERINSYCDSIGTTLGYVEVVEELMDIQIPDRAKYLRVIAAELNRIASHLYAVSLVGISAGFETMLMWTINDRELILDLLVKLSGQRITYTYPTIGGVRWDMPDGFKEEALERLGYLEKRLEDYYRMMAWNRTFQMRFKNVGILKSSDAVGLGIVGPNLRASGVKVDVRKDEPYEVYDRFDFEVPTGKNGDSFDRASMRLKEIEQSIVILRQALKDIPNGPIKCSPKGSKVPPTAPRGEAYSRVESARGEFGYYLVSDGKSKPYRLKISTPSFRNLPALPFLCRNIPLGDIPVIFITFDYIPLDVDR